MALGRKTGGRRKGTPNKPLSMRLDAAKSAVKFERPALASTVLTQRSGLDALSLDDLERLLALAEAAAAAGGWDALAPAAEAPQRAAIG